MRNLTQKKQYLQGYLYVSPAVILLILIGIYPLADLVVLSFHRIRADKPLEFVGLLHFIYVFKDKWFWNSFKADLIFTAFTLILHLVLGMGFALLLNERWVSTTLRNLMRSIIIMPWVFSTAASALIWTLLLHPFGILNFLAKVLFNIGPIDFLSGPWLAMFSLVSTNVWMSFPFFMVLILSGLQSIPVELYEAARVDGAGPFKRFVYITIPQLRTLLGYLVIIDTIGTLSQVDLPRLLTGGGPSRFTETLPYHINRMGLLSGNIAYGAALSVVMLIFVVAIIGTIMKAVIQKE